MPINTYQNPAQARTAEEIVQTTFNAQEILITIISNIANIKKIFETL